MADTIVFNIGNDLKPTSLTMNGKTYDVTERPSDPPKPTMRRLSKEDVPELEKQLIEMDRWGQTMNNYNNGLNISIHKRHRAELFLCIECLKLGGECFSKPDRLREMYIVVFREDKWIADTFFRGFLTFGEFIFPALGEAKVFLEIQGVTNALHEFYMIEKP